MVGVNEILVMGRKEMVAELRRRGISDAAVLNTMKTVPREAFVLPAYQDFAYEDTPLPIPEGQTISQPFIVAYMISALELKAADRVLEIGTGSGYEAALLSRIVQEVYTIERHKELVQYASRRLVKLGYDNVWVRHGDGTLGWPNHAPFDAIIVSAGGPSVPPSLLEQLAVDGRLVIPIGQHRRQQVLVRYKKDKSNTISSEPLGSVAFVPLIGTEGWNEDHKNKAGPMS